jgi:hypothetical protein
MLLKSISIIPQVFQLIKNGNKLNKRGKCLHGHVSITILIYIYIYLKINAFRPYIYFRKLFDF